jgi:phage terminase large subunit-like protein
MIRRSKRDQRMELLNFSRGRVQRAEPVAALYAQGKVRHVGHFPELERQQCLFSTGGYVGKSSRDHADACIWGLTELMPGASPGAALFEHYGDLLAEREAA